MDSLKVPAQSLAVPIKEKAPWQSKNFWTNVTTIIFSILAFSFGVELDPVIGGNIFDAITTQNWLLLITTMWNVVNIIIHITKKKAEATTVLDVVKAAVSESKKSGKEYD